MSKKREKDGQRKSQRTFKSARRNLRKTKTQKTRTLELHEGVTYESCVALNQSEEDKTTISNGTINNLKASLTEEEFNGYAEIINKSSLVGQDEDNPSELFIDYLECNCLFLTFDIETTGFHQHSDIIQIACTSQDGSSTFSRYLLFTEDIADSATRVHGISLEFRNGQKVLVREGKELTTTAQERGLTEFCDFLQDQVSCVGNVVLVAHNGSQFDFPILLNALKRHDLLHIFFSLNTPLLDSLKVIKQMKRTHNPIKACQCNSPKELYEFPFKKKLQAHDAWEDVTALSQILFRSSLKLSQRELLQSSVSIRRFHVGLQRRQESKG